MITAQVLWDVREGRTSFDEFVRAHKVDIRRLVCRAMVSNADLDDMTQEFLMAAFEAIENVWPDGDIRQHVIFRACSVVRRLSRRKLSLDIAGDDWTTRSPLGLLVDGQQEELAEASQRLRILPRTDLQRAVMSSLYDHGSVDAAVEELLSDPETRKLFSDSSNPRRTVYVTAKKLAKRAQAA